MEAVICIKSIVGLLNYKFDKTFETLRYVQLTILAQVTKLAIISMSLLHVVWNLTYSSVHVFLFAKRMFF